eukprot:45871-Eustigmatos_ZCMA.PRE.1
MSERLDYARRMDRKSRQRTKLPKDGDRRRARGCRNESRRQLSRRSCYGDSSCRASKWVMSTRDEDLTAPRLESTGLLAE